MNQPTAINIRGRSGVRITLWDYGGAGALLLFVHCAGTHGRIWDPVIERLRLSAHVLSLDLRGHGDSEKPAHPSMYHWECYAEDVMAVVDAMGGVPWLGAVGHSGGGVAVTLTQLNRCGCFPRWCLVDAILAPAHFFPERAPLAEGARRRKRHFASLSSAQARLGGKFPFNEWSKDAFDAYLKHGFEDRGEGGIVLKCPGELEALFYEAGSTEAILHRLGEVAAPALLITGSRSYMHDHVQMQHTCAPPGSRLKVLPEVGHFIPQEAPEALAVLLNDWFGGIS